MVDQSNAMQVQTVQVIMMIRKTTSADTTYMLFIAQVPSIPNAAAVEVCGTGCILAQVRKPIQRPA